MARRTQILIAAVLSVVLTAIGTYHVVHLKMVPDSIMAFWFPFTLIADGLGMPGEIAIWAEQSPAWDTDLPVIARYPASGILASGWLLGEKVLANRAALVDAPIGKGRAILFGMRPQYRAQSYLTMKLLWNAFLL